jgi:hypothetical protein
VETKYEEEHTVEFNPVDNEWQTQRAKMLGVKVRRPTQLCSGPRRTMTPTERPPTTITMRGDGNCLFRAVSYYLAGDQSYHKALRDIIVTYMAENAPIIGTIADQPTYATKNNMIIPGVYATEVEIFAFASMLATNIFVYSPYGNDTKGAIQHKWQCYAPHSQLTSQFTQSTTAIYITNFNEHFEPVISMD